MKTLRLIVTLLLCLSVPMAGWASVMGGPLCAPLQHRHATAPTAHHPAFHAGHHADELATATVAASHHHDHASHGGPACPHDKSCLGDDCACGCGMGTCSSSQLSLLSMQIQDFAPPLGQQQQPNNNQPAILDTRGASPLRPPIS